MGDPDVDIINCKGQSSFVDGVHLGHLRPLGPTPQVYRPRSKEPSCDESDWSLNMDNYFRGSEEEAERILAEQFKEEESAGRMKPFSEKEAKKICRLQRQVAFNLAFSGSHGVGRDPLFLQKVSGGFALDYVGYWMDYSRFEIGISERRTAWLVNFIDKLEASGWLVMVRRFPEFHGRLGFSAQVLPWIRPYWLWVTPGLQRYLRTPP